MQRAHCKSLALLLARSMNGQVLFCNRFLANVNSRSRSLYAIARPSVCLSVVCNARAPYTKAVQIFGNISKIFGTLAIR